MSNSRGTDIKLLKVVKRCIVLSVLLPTVSVLAQTPATPAKDSMQATQANQFSATPRTVSAYNSTARNKTIFRKASTIDLSKTPKVSRDDFGRLLLTVRQPKNTRMIWLGNKNRSHKPAKPKTLWLGKKNRSD